MSGGLTGAAADAGDGPLDGARLHLARLEAGLSLSAAASHARMTAASLTLIETRGGSNRGAVTVGQVVRLAELLGVPLAEVWRSHPGPVSSVGGSDTDDVDLDAGTLGSVMHAAGRSVVLAEVADTLGWPARRASDAVARLRVLAASTGADIVRRNGLVAFRASSSGADRVTVDAAARRVDATHGMSHAEAALAYALLAPQRDGGGVDAPGVGDALTRRRIVALVRKGVLQPDPDGAFTPSNALTEALTGVVREKTPPR